MAFGRAPTTLDRRSLFRNVSALSLGAVVQLPLNFCIVVYVARVAGPEGFGALSFSTSVLAYLAVVASLGLPTLATREVAQCPENVQKTAGEIVGASLLLALLTIGVECATVAWMPLSPLDRTLILILSSQLVAGAVNLTWAYAGVERLAVPALAGVLGTTVRLAMVLMLLRAPHDIEVAAIAAGVGTLVTSGIQFVAFRRQFPFSIQMRPTTAMRLVRKSLPLGASALLIQIYYNAGPVILGYSAGNHEVGYYSAASRPVMLLITFTGLYVQSLFPIISRLYRNDASRIKPFLQSMLRLTIFLGLPVSITVSILAPSLLALLYGNAYLSAIYPLRILIWSWFIIAVSVHYGNVLIACNEEKKYTTGVALGAVMAIIANLLLIPEFGAVGAAYANLLSEITVLGFMVGAIRPVLGYYFVRWGYFTKVVLGGLLTGSVTALAQPRMALGLTVAGSVLVYTLLARLMKILPSVMDLRTIMRVGMDI